MSNTLTDPSPHEDLDLNEHITTCIKRYEQSTETDEVLWYMFKDDFESWTEKHFDLAHKHLNGKLRFALRCKGIWVETDGKKALLPKALMQTLDGVDPPVWTKKELLRMATTGDKDLITSRSLKAKIAMALANDPCFDLLAAAENETTPQTRDQVDNPQTMTRDPSVQPIRGLSMQPSEPQVRMTTELPGMQQQRTTYPTSYKFKAPFASPQPTQLSTPQTIPLPLVENLDVQGHNYSREIANMTKMYTEEMKYGGGGDNFSLKLIMFYDICNRIGLPMVAFKKGLPGMLKGLALGYYYTTLIRADMTFEQTCQCIQEHFEDASYKRHILTEWNQYTLSTVKAKNPDKSTSDCFTIMVDKLQNLYYGLGPALQTEEFMHDKLITACQGVKDCQIACAAPPPTLSALISSLKTSILAYENANRTTTETFMTDRRYQSNRSNYSRNNNPSRNQYAPRDYKKRKKCFVCHKEDCWSSEHPQTEQQEAKNRFKAKYSNRYNGNGSRFEKVLRQYIIECEGTEEEGIADTIDALLLENDDEEQDITAMDNSHIEPQDAFFMSLGQVSAEDAAVIVSKLSDQAFLHSITPETAGTASEYREYNGILTSRPGPVGQMLEDSDLGVILTNTRYHDEKFFGIMIDTGASMKSTVGYGQYQAYNSIHDSPISEIRKGEVKIKFGIGTTSSIGSITVESPIGNIDFHVVEADTPFLLCLADMDRLRVHYNNVTDVLITPTGELPIVRRFGHPFLVWSEAIHPFLQELPCYLTEVEIRQLHRRFGHPSVGRLQRVLERAGHEVDTTILQHLTKFCKYCQKYGRSPGRFRFTLREDVDFNYCIYVDIMYIDGKPLLHIVDEGTRYQAGRWLDNISAKTVWEKLQECWMSTYLGPPDLLVHDAGKSFMSKEFKHYAKEQGVTTKDVPVEAHNSVGIVERYHGPVRRAYKIISEELPDLGEDSALQMAFKAINDSAGPDGLVPTLLVFGAYPRMSEHDAPSPTVRQRSLALKKAMNEIYKLRAKRQVNDALKQRNGPNTDMVKSLPLNSDVLVWREVPGANKLGKWTGPYPLISVDREECIIDLSSGPTKFRTTVVKPYHRDDDTEDTGEPEEEEEGPPVMQPVQQPLQPVAQPLQQTLQEPIRRGRGRPRKHPLPIPTVNTMDIVTEIEIFIGDPDRKNLSSHEALYEQSRLKEINGLMDRDVFEFIKTADLPPKVRLFNSRFVDEIKNKDTDKAFEKSRLVIQAYNDAGKSCVLTQSPTIQRVSQRIVLSIAAILPEYSLCLRDITQAYTQSTTKLNRDFYVRPPANVAQWEGLYLKVIKPLYGVPEAGNHWFETYHKHHQEKLRLTQSTYDPCLLFVNEASYFGLVGLQTDDTLFLGSKDFLMAEETELKKAKFMSKEREQLTTDNSIKFNGGRISLQSNGTITLTQEIYNKMLKTVEQSPADLTSSRGTVRPNASIKDQSVAQRARGAYLATVSQPEASFDLSFAAQTVNPGKDDIKLLNKRIQWQIDNPKRGLDYVKLDKHSLKLVVFTDSSFANNKDYTSQIGYVIVLMDKTNNANLIHWSSTKCKRVTRSVLAAELYAMSNGYDMAASVKTTIGHILDIKLPLVVCTDSKSLYDCLVKLGTTQEKRLMIDLMCLRQAYERREISEIKWIDGGSNPADAMTKSAACSALRDLIDTNQVNIKATEWVERGNDEELGHTGLGL